MKCSECFKTYIVNISLGAEHFVKQGLARLHLAATAVLGSNAGG